MIHGIAINVTAATRQNGDASPVTATHCRPQDRRAFVTRLRDCFTSLFDRFFSEPRIESQCDNDVRDKGGTIIVRVNAPGFEARDLDVKLQGNLLVLRACKPIDATGTKRDFDELRFRELYHCEPILSAIDAARTEASFCDGVLTVSLPKRLKVRAVVPSLQVSYKSDCGGDRKRAMIRFLSNPFLSLKDRKRYRERFWARSERKGG
jgi:HSP20 family molecular chaperone IbpA